MMMIPSRSFVPFLSISLLLVLSLLAEKSEAFSTVPATGHHRRSSQHYLLRTSGTLISPTNNPNYFRKQQQRQQQFVSTIVTTTTLVVPPLSMARGAGGGGDDIQGTDRILSCLPYLLPIMDGDRYGRYIFALLPPLGMADAILLGPFKLIYFGIPFSQFIAFLGLSFLSRNPNISRPVRFNMQQALLLDILLIFPSLFGRLPFGMPSIVVESGTNFVFYVLIASVGYSLFSNLTGKLPNQIPIVSEASEMQIGPF